MSPNPGLELLWVDQEARDQDQIQATRVKQSWLALCLEYQNLSRVSVIAQVDELHQGLAELGHYAEEERGAHLACGVILRAELSFQQSVKEN